MIVYDATFINNYRKYLLDNKTNNVIEKRKVWKPKKCLTIEDSLESNIRSLLNKITDTNYNTIFNKLNEMKIPSIKFLEECCIPIIFDKITNDVDYLDIYILILKNLDNSWNITDKENYLNFSIRAKILEELTLNNLSKLKKKYSLLFFSKYKQKKDINLILNKLLKLDTLEIPIDFEINEEYIELFIFYLENTLHYFDNKNILINFIDSIIEKNISERLYYLLINLKEKVITPFKKKVCVKHKIKLNVNKKPIQKKNKPPVYDEKKVLSIVTDYFMSFDEMKLKELNFTNDRKKIQKILEHSFEIFTEDKIDYKIYNKLFEYLIKNNYVNKVQISLFLMKKKEAITMDYPNIIDNYNKLIKDFC